MPFKSRTQRVLILGSGLPAERIARVIERHGPAYRVIGFIADQEGQERRAQSPELQNRGGGSPGSRVSTLGSLSDLQVVVQRIRPDRIVIALTERRGKLPVRECLAFRAEGVVVEDWVELYERITGKVAIESLSPGTFLFSKVFEINQFQARLLRSLDILYGIVGILFTAPLMLMIAAAIKLDSTGPTLFVHERMGYKGRPFKLLKFRTMAPPSGKTSEWAKDNEARVTRVGRILRKYRLDELPQFLNILVGQMSLVGPRPHPVTNAGLFFDEIPYYLVRSKVRPGVTGWAQIRFGYANDLDEETEKMRYDLYYIKHRSILFDLRILFETIWIVLFGRGSEETTEESDYEVSRNHRQEHEYGWQTTFKTSAQSSRSDVQPLDRLSTVLHLGDVPPARVSGATSDGEPAAFDAEPEALAAAAGGWLQRVIDPSDLSFYDALERQIIASEIRRHLGDAPLVETRNKRKLHGNSLAPWELRTDKYRIFYEAREESRQVTVVAVGHKEGDRLFLRGQEVAL